MEIKALRALRGPNYYHRKPVIIMKLDISTLEEKPTNLVPNFKANTEKTVQSLYDHTCSVGVKGGFFIRLERGTWAGHVVEHVAIELQRLIGHEINYGKTITLKEKGHYYVVYRYLNEAVGLRAGEMAVQIVSRLFEGHASDITAYIEELKTLSEISEFGPSTQAIVNEALKRGIPYCRLNNLSYVQLGQGKHQRRIEATIIDRTSGLGIEIAADKERTKDILARAGIPVPKGKSFQTYEAFRDFALQIGFPVVVKPYNGNHGRAVTINITNEVDLKEAFDRAKTISHYVLVEQYLTGKDFRLLVIDGKFEAAALREPATIIGDGEKTVRELIQIENQNPHRGEGHENILTKIAIDKETEECLRLQDVSLDQVVEKGAKVYLKYTANISSGGTAEDVTDTVHPANKKIVERIARLIGLDITGIDVVAESLEKPFEQGQDGIVEVNVAPGLRMHLYPSKGASRNVAKAIVDMLFPEGQGYDIPICAITGTNGKTTTTRLISHILSLSGKVVGMASTDAVVIDNMPILKGDYSGPGGAQAVMRENSVDYAVLETARGGILRRGLGF